MELYSLVLIFRMRRDICVYIRTYTDNLYTYQFKNYNNGTPVKCSPKVKLVPVRVIFGSPVIAIAYAYIVFLPSMNIMLLLKSHGQ